MTLYREANDMEMLYPTAEVKELFVVPVEPDYKAAEEAFSERSTDSRSIVDAALGVGRETL